MSKIGTTRIRWIGYSWFLGSSKSYLCVAEGIEGENCRFYPLSWNSSLKPVAPPSPGIVNTIGLSGLGGYLQGSQSKLSPMERAWAQQVQCLEEKFERLLADVLQGVIRNIIAKEEGFSDLFIAIQGPAFPKLLGRLCYRNIGRQDEGVSVLFVTFRRRFLTPSPLINNEEISGAYPGMLYGPLPSDHEESMTNRYYLLPKSLDVTHTSGRFSPMMIEHLRHGLEQDHNATRIARFLDAIGLCAGPKSIYANGIGDSEWSIYPDEHAFQKVIVPQPLLAVHRKSYERLQELLGEANLASGRERDMDSMAKDFVGAMHAGGMEFAIMPSNDSPNQVIAARMNENDEHNAAKNYLKRVLPMFENSKKSKTK